jgi:hypothetical protein
MRTTVSPLLRLVSPRWSPRTFTSIRVNGVARTPASKVGNVDTSVIVVADTLSVPTESSESGGTISAKEVANLMLNGRNFQQLATPVPGVSSVNGTNQQVNAGYLGQTDLIVNGTSSEDTTFTIDGVCNMMPTSLININITPSIDAINEMRVLKTLSRRNTASPARAKSLRLRRHCS